LPEPKPRALALHGVPRAVKYARERLNDPELSETRFRHWIADRKVRFRKFGGMYVFVTDELDEDLCGKVVEPA
jgi:hypothetical protein